MGQEKGEQVYWILAQHPCPGPNHFHCVNSILICRKISAASLLVSGTVESSCSLNNRQPSAQSVPTKAFFKLSQIVWALNIEDSHGEYIVLVDLWGVVYY